MHTRELIAKAEATGRSARELARAMGVTETALGQAKRRGHLSPAEAAVLARELGESEAAWALAAAAEATRSPVLARSLAKMAEEWRKR